MQQPTLLLSITLGAALLVSACDPGSGSSGANANIVANLPSSPTNATLSIEAIKTFAFTWEDSADATHYQLLENTDGQSGFSQVGDNIAAGEQSVNITVPLYARTNAQYIIDACNSAGCTSSQTLSVSDNLTQAIGYLKASNADADDQFGRSVSISDDGTTLAVGAALESSSSSGINSTPDDTAYAAGAVYVFSQTNGTWQQQAYLKASNTNAGDAFGVSVSLSGNGDFLAVGALGEESNATGINGDQTDNSASNAGAVYIFKRTGNSWRQADYLKTSNTGAGDQFGISVNLNSSGNTLAVGAVGEDSNATGIDGDQNDNSASNSGAVYVFTQNAGTWSQQTYLKASNTEEDDGFGSIVSLSANGHTLAVSASREDSNATGVDGNGSNNSAEDAGAVYVFSRSGEDWSQQAYLKASNTDANDSFSTISISADGNTLAVGAYLEDSNATSINGNQADNSTENAGAVYIFNRTGSSWNQTAYLKASNSAASDLFGSAVSLAANGTFLAVSATGDDSASTGINSTFNDDGTADNSGAVYLFSLNSGVWSQSGTLKASNTDASDNFGSSVSVSEDGNAIAVVSKNEDSNATGINGDQTNNDAGDSGALYLY
ncbi:beta strand repeat-containing protein [Reinekea sp.]|uniref:beta strand repeat-containing protein n=1 Tax=Reinekea sp. TaxID=1970455 RepID=UPI003988CDAC